MVKNGKSNVPKRLWFRFDSVPASESQTRSPKVEKNKLLPLYSSLRELINPIPAVTPESCSREQADRSGPAG